MAHEDALLEYKSAPTEFNAIGDKGEYEGLFSVFGNRDEYNDIVERGAFTKTLQERAGRIRVFYAHDWQKLIGPPPEVIKETEVGLYAKGRLTLGSLWGREAWELMKDKALVEGSIGYVTVKATVDEEMVRHLHEVKLWEISPVPFGANPLTRIQAVKMGLLASKGAIPPHTTSKADEDADWDADAVLKEVEGARKLRLIHAWVDDDADPDTKEAYKLPHHYADGRVVWKGVAAAGAAIMGARGGVSIPAVDIPGVKRHLARHYEQFDKTPPWEEAAGFSEYAETLQVICDQIVSGKVLATAPRERVIAVYDALQRTLEVLHDKAAATPVDQSVNHLALLRSRLRAVELALSL